MECTVNRIGGAHFSQLRRSGHFERIEDDLDAFASLGLSALRYPVLWEDVEAPSGTRDFSSADRALHRLADGPMRPIVGMVHHGSGPLSTSLVDDDFAERLADFAGDIARRYPWVTDYTPVNEPLTTARFSGLYGHWYPHARDDRTFVHILITELRATVLAMRAVREVNPSCRLVQTEDFGRAQGTPPMREQVAFENDRRWLAFDLLCGRVTPEHPLYRYLTGPGGAHPGRLQWFVENTCPPGILGINSYPRSNRWLDHRLELFDRRAHGGNGMLRFADVGASDTALAEAVSLLSLIEEVWNRYRLPVALTEIHVPGSATEQVAWWYDALAAAATAQSRGVDVQGVTSWSLLGSYDWDTLCTSRGTNVTYESGAFEIRDGRRCLTVVGEAVRAASARAARPMAIGRQ